MHVHAIYEDGRLTFQQPIRFKTQRIELDVNIPDNYILDDDQVEEIMISKVCSSSLQSVQPATETQSETGSRLNAIVGPLRGTFGTMSPQEVKEVWHQHLEEKYLDAK